MPCSLVHVYQYFGETCRHHLHSISINCAEIRTRLNCRLQGQNKIGLVGQKHDQVIGEDKGRLINVLPVRLVMYLYHRVQCCQNIPSTIQHHLVHGVQHLSENVAVIPEPLELTKFVLITAVLNC
jgi:hypothetical protein